MSLTNLTREPLEGWPWRPDLCPADQDFIEWLIQRQLKHPPDSVFHMGTGLHHRVGRYCARFGIPCLGLTASLDEYHAWTRRSALHNSCYEVEIATLASQGVARGRAFDVITLFHLGEMEGRFGPINPEATDRLVGHGLEHALVLLYMGSSGYHRAIDYAKASPLLRPLGTFKSLAIFDIEPEHRRPHVPQSAR